MFAVPNLTITSGCTSHAVATERSDSTVTLSFPTKVCDGSPMQPLDGDRGSLVAFIFISTDCPIANAMLPDLRSLIRYAEERDVALYLVYPSPSQSRGELASHAREFGLDGDAGCRDALLADPTQSLVSRVGATIVPEAALLRRDGAGGGQILYRGRVNDLYVGIGRRRPQVSSNDLRDAIDTALAGRSPSRPFPKAIGCFIESSR